MLSNRCLRQSKGFTLIEMMVAVAILSILLAIAAPSFQTMIANVQLRSSAESLMAGLQLARTEAMRRNTAVSFWLVNNVNAGCALSNTSASWVVSLNALAGNCNATAAPDVAPRIVQVRAGNEIGGNVTISALNATGTAASCVTFNGFGGVSANCTGGGAITPINEIRLTSTATNAGRRTVQIGAGGGIRICDPAVNSVGHPLNC